MPCHNNGCDQGCNKHHDKTDRGGNKDKYKDPCKNGCKKPCKCPKNNVIISYILAQGSANCGTPTSLCSTECAFYLDLRSCTLWTCTNGEWVIVEINEHKWYYYQECNQTIWRVCRGRRDHCHDRDRCKIVNIGDKSCDCDIFIDSHRCRFYKYYNCRWHLKMECGGIEVFFATIGSQRISIVSRFDGRSVEKSFVARDATGADVIIGNAYYDKYSKRLYSFDKEKQSWIYKTIPSSTSHIVDAWGTFLHVNGNNGTKSPKQGDLLIDGSDCSFYTWDECLSEWVFQTRFGCGEVINHRSPRFLNIIDQHPTTSSTKIVNYGAGGSRGNLNFSLVNGDFTVSTNALYGLQFEFAVTFNGGSVTPSTHVTVSIVLNNDFTKILATRNVFNPNVILGTNSTIGSTLSTIVALNANDVVSLYLFLPINMLTSTVSNFTVIQYVKGKRP